MKRGITDLDRIIGANIRVQRLIRSVSRSTLAEALGISCNQLQKYETGANRISAARLFLIADLLDVPMQAFHEPRV